MRTTPTSSKRAASKPIATESKQLDAIGLLMEDHEHVKDLFEQFEDLGDRAMVSKKKLADEICMELTKHTMVEEEIFYPAVRAAGKEFEDLIDEAVVEHASAKQLIGQIQSMDAGDDLFDAKVKVLSEQIDHHVKEEEDEMFPKVRKAKLDLATLGRQMAERKAGIAEE
ncbi:hemerythrin domain-containing protein [Pseudoduganella namucuonensis]|uniref:Hemerythrin HHE cation binding domain-containing protein n=1 Tax=Pseudoduganella namucuonensis TaxID=1035707 RepID=A0A1I7H8S9_9BURK|nr:hemerythrin domain-containing protein [Pseudoduganella namucuonensis]SFU57121.1 Hemerythrin HHE cation binding domain-containing protein [Pseudoduganella namucuonensis]